MINIPLIISLKNRYFIMSNLFSDEKVNTGRQVELDIAKHYQLFS